MGGRLPVRHSEGGLYFDGAPVPKAARDLPPQAMPSSPYPPVELVATVPAGAGPHSVEARYDCASGVNTGFYMPSGITWSVFLLGS
jgi:hypothetical protein